jgi:hypothetical protein
MGEQLMPFLRNSGDETRTKYSLMSGFVSKSIRTIGSAIVSQHILIVKSTMSCLYRRRGVYRITTVYP